MKLKSLYDFRDEIGQKGDKEEYELTSQQIEIEEAKLSELKDKLTSLEDKNKKLDTDIQMLEEKIKRGTSNQESFDKLLSGEKAQIDEKSMQLKDLERLKHYKQVNIMPDEYKLTSVKFLNSFSEEVSPIFLVLIIMLIIGDIVSSEHSDGTMRLYLAQPVPKEKVLVSKYIAAIIASVSVVVGVQLLIFVIIGLVNGFGPINAPIEFGASFVLKNGLPSYVANSQSFLPAYSFILYYLLLEILFIITLASVAFLVSNIFTKATASLTFGACFSLFLYYVFIASARKSFLQPFVYISFADLWAVLSGNMQQSNLSLTLNNSILVFSFTTILCFVCSYILFKRQETYS
jgi:ABC-2 type transport system permease protein